MKFKLMWSVNHMPGVAQVSPATGGRQMVGALKS